MANLELLVQVQDRELQQLRKDVRTLSREMGGFSSSTRGATTSYSKLSRESTKANREIGRTTRGVIAGSGAFRGLGRAIAFASGAYLGAAGFTAVVRGAYDELQKQATVNAQTNSVLKSTGRIAGVTRGEVERLAKSLEHKTGVDDDAVKTSENLLLTFTNIRHVVGQNNDIFARASKAALDLSVRFHKDLSQSSVVLGRALQDPIGGLTTLSRIGVRFSDSQKATIKSLVDSGNVLGAQKLILAEVEKRAKGAAQAYGRTLPGQIDKARESFKDLSAAALKPLVPELSKAAQAAAKFFQKPSTQRELLDGVHEITTAVKEVTGAVLAAKDAVGGWKHLLELLIALKVAKTVYGWSSALADTAVNAGKARTATGGLRVNLANLIKMSAKPIQFVIAYSIIRKITGSGADLSDPTAPDAFRGNNPFPVGTERAAQFAAGRKGIRPGTRVRVSSVNGQTVVTPAPRFQDTPQGRDAEAQLAKFRHARIVSGKAKLQALGAAFFHANYTEVDIDQEMKAHGYTRAQRLEAIAGYRAESRRDAQQQIGTTIVAGRGTSAGAFRQGQRATGAERGTTAKQRAVVATAKRLGPGSGAVYVTGGTGPTGYDCSGYLYAIYKRNGITIPRTSEAQWADPNAIQVAKGQEKPGDGVYFTGSSQYAPPGHCGIYIGNDHYIEYFSSGRPARVSRLSEASDYWGARRWIKIKQSAASGGGTTNRPTSGQVPKKPKRKKGHTTTLSDLFGTPAGLQVQTALALARGTKSPKDDVKALQGELRFLQQQLGLAKKGTQLRVDILDEIGSVKEQLRSGKVSAKKDPKTGDLVPVRLRLGLSKAEGTAGLQDDLAALRKIQSFLRGALKGTKGEKRIGILDELNTVRSQIGGIVRDILDKAQTEITKRRTGLSGAFSKVADSLLSSFDDKTSQLVNGINQQFDQLTPAEQALLGIQNRERGFQRQDLVADVTKAQARLARATGRRHDQALRDLQQAQDALGQFDLEPLAQAERDAAEKRRQAALDALDKQRSQERAALEAKIAEFQKMLETGALNMGSAFARGLLAAFPEFKKAVDKYVKYLQDNGLTGTPGSGVANQAKKPLPLDPAIATAIRNHRRTKTRSLSSATAPPSQTAPVVQLVPVIFASDMVDATAKYNRRNGRQAQ